MAELLEGVGEVQFWGQCSVSQSAIQCTYEYAFAAILESIGVPIIEPISEQSLQAQWRPNQAEVIALLCICPLLPAFSIVLKSIQEYMYVHVAYLVHR